MLIDAELSIVFFSLPASSFERVSLKGQILNTRMRGILILELAHYISDWII